MKTPRLILLSGLCALTFSSCTSSSGTDGTGTTASSGGGYGFVPTPVPDQTGITNYMDSDRHVVSAGVGLRYFPRSAPGPINIDLGGQYQQLVTRTVPPAWTLISFTTPGPGLRSSFSIFMASTMMTPWPAATVSPTATRTLTILPGMGERMTLRPSVAPA